MDWHWAVKRRMLVNLAHHSGFTAGLESDKKQIRTASNATLVHADLPSNKTRTSFTLIQQQCSYVLLARFHMTHCTESSLKASYPFTDSTWQPASG